MSSRITSKDLDRLAELINSAAGVPDDVAASYGVGAFYVSNGYGGYKLVRIDNEARGVEGFDQAYQSARETYRFMSGFLKALEYAKRS